MSASDHQHGGHLEVPTSQQPRGCSEVRQPQRGANTRTTDPLTPYLAGRCRSDSIAKFVRQRADIFQIPFSLVAKAKVIAKGEILDTQPLNKHSFNKIAGAELPQAFVERQTQHTVHTAGLQQWPLVP